MCDLINDENVDIAVELSWSNLANLEFSEELLKLLEECKASERDWANSLNGAAKEELKKILFVNQKAQCAYCRRKIKDEAGHVEIDHILPKSAKGKIARYASNDDVDRFCTPGYSHFTYEVRNLILTCKRCNNKKGTYDSRLNRSIAASAAYDLNPGYYAWMHPHIDDYSTHISLYKGLLYQTANSSIKGDTLIRVCKLDKIAAVEVLARQLVADSASSYTKAITALLGELDTIGWENLIDSVVEAFPDVDPEVIESKAADFKKLMAD